MYYLITDIVQAYAFPRTSDARNPIVIVRIFRARAGNLQSLLCSLSYRYHSTFKTVRRP